MLWAVLELLNTSSSVNVSLPSHSSWKSLAIFCQEFFRLFFLPERLLDFLHSFLETTLLLLYWVNIPLIASFNTGSVFSSGSLHQWGSSFLTFANTWICHQTSSEKHEILKIGYEKHNKRNHVETSFLLWHGISFSPCQMLHICERLFDTHSFIT